MMIILVSSGIALLLACTAFVTYEQVNTRQGMTRDLSVTARMIGLNSTAALAFDDPGVARQTLEALNAHPHVISACIYDADGAIFATYQRYGSNRTEWPPAQYATEEFTSESLKIFQDIHLGSDRVGTIFLQADLRQIRERWVRYGIIVAAVMVVSILLTFVIASRLQRLISGPISHLDQIVGRVALNNDFSLRAVKQSEDEIGRLTDSFNAMMSRIEAQNAELLAARVDLERKVEERTADLLSAKEEAEEERSTLQFIFDNVPVGISLITWDGQRKSVASRFINKTHLEICGISPDQRNESHLFKSMTHPDDRPRQARLQEKLDAGEIDHYSLEKRYLKPDGGIVWVHFYTHRRYYLDGSAQNLTTIIDITDRKKAIEELDLTHQRLLNASRQAGMAEVATSVLHNVGNVLNSVNITTTLLTDRLQRSRCGSLVKLSELIDQQNGNLAHFLTEDSRGKVVPSYLKDLSHHLREERTVMLEEVRSLRKNIDHIKEIVAMQQSYATVSAVKEEINLVELVEDALRMNDGAFARHGVNVARDYRIQPLITTEKHKVLQILINLLRNAKYACDEADTDNKTITIRLASAGDMVEVLVIDTGIGIVPENMDRIFSHGFTTRENGHGFGLHSGALAARELGGTLKAFSRGQNQGATFTLSLPAE